MGVSLARGDTSIDMACYPLELGAEKARFLDGPVLFKIRVTTYLKSDHGIAFDDGPYDMAFSSTRRRFLIPQEALAEFISDELSHIDAPFATHVAAVVDHWMPEISSHASRAAQEAHRIGTGFELNAHIRVFCRPELLDDANEIDGALVLSADGVLELSVGGLETVKFSRDGGGFREPACVICCEDFVHGMELMRMVDCSHVFHGMCLAQWLERSPVCPLCRKRTLPPSWKAIYTES